MGAGLRERKKQLTREVILTAAAALFAEHGYENVSVRQVAAAAQVAEQTLYNYFPSKEHLVLDRNDEFRNRLAQAVRDRPPGTSPAQAVHGIATETLDRIAALDPIRARGGLPFLAATSPGIRRICLEMTDQHADAIAGALLSTDPGLGPARAKLHAIALAWVFQSIIDGLGAAQLAGRTPHDAVSAMRPVIVQMLGDLTPPTA